MLLTWDGSPEFRIFFALSADSGLQLPFGVALTGPKSIQYTYSHLNLSLNSSPFKKRDKGFFWSATINTYLWGRMISTLKAFFPLHLDQVEHRMYSFRPMSNLAR